MASVEFEHIDKVYPGGTQAVCDLSLRVSDGELIVFVGPSGCGKSTLLKLLAGLEEVTRGVLRIGEQVVNGLPPQHRNVAMVFQDYALYPHISVRGNLEFPLKMRKLPRAEIERRVHWVSELLGLGELLDRLPKQLSGGQRQRVAMGRALVRNPTVFLLDEPLSNLDAKLRVQVRAEISELQRQTHTTMIYVTHDQVEAMTLGERVAVIHQGQLQQVASPQELYARPANVFVAGFIGSPPMNLFPTRLASDAWGQTAITLGEQSIPISPADLTALSLQVYMDKPLTAGIRPEAFRLALSECARGCIQVTVENPEYLGHETLVYVRAGGLVCRNSADFLVARLPGTHRFTKGDTLWLQVESSQVYLFSEEGRALAA